MKFLSFLFPFSDPASSGAVASCEQVLCWMRDPLSHPEIERMDERQRGDLPLNPALRRSLPGLGRAGCRA